jgi:hypothetical protein
MIADLIIAPPWLILPMSEAGRPGSAQLKFRGIGPFPGPGLRLTRRRGPISGPFRSVRHLPDRNQPDEARKGQALRPPRCQGMPQWMEIRLEETPTVLERHRPVRQPCVVAETQTVSASCPTVCAPGWEAMVL